MKNSGTPKHGQNRRNVSGTRRPRQRGRPAKEHGQDESTWTRTALRWLSELGFSETEPIPQSSGNAKEYSFPLVAHKPLNVGRNNSGEKSAHQPNQRLYSEAHKSIDLEPEMTHQARVAYSGPT